MISIEQSGLKIPIKLFLAGGAAVHWWTRDRVTGDLDIDGGIQLGVKDLRIAYFDESGNSRILYLDKNYNPMFGLMHENYQEEAYPIGKNLGIQHIFDLRVLTPVHLAISKVSRLSLNDAEDIKNLAQKGLIQPQDFDIKATDALRVSIGHNQLQLEHNIKKVSQIIHEQTPTILLSSSIRNQRKLS